MASNSSNPIDHAHAAASTEKVSLGGQAPFFLPLLGMGVIGLAAALIAVFTFDKGEPGIGRFYHAYLLAFCFCLSISLGSLFFVLIQHTVRAGWSVNVRRIFETFASAMPIFLVLAIPILVAVWSGKAELYHWAVPKVAVEHEHSEKQGAEHETKSHAAIDSTLLLVEAGNAYATSELVAADFKTADSKTDKAIDKQETPNNEINPETSPPKKPIGYHTAYGYNTFDDFTRAKYAFLNPTFFTLRLGGYFIIWSIMAWYFYSLSRKQDASGDVELTLRMSRRAPVCLVIFGCTIYFAAMDLVMTLDHHWYSSMFGIQFFAGSVIGAFATVIITLTLLKKAGYLAESVTTEHLHDLAKFMFGFIVFWGYVTYSQYMLIWYANLPETTAWFERRGATTSVFAVVDSAWSGIALILLFGHLLLPFPLLLSRHIKRNKDILLFACVWMLVIHWIDLFWNIVPELNNGKFYLGVPEIGCLVGVLGLFLAFVSYRLSKGNLRPIRDPRQAESMGFHTM